jgi:hypothetical protein
MCTLKKSERCQISHLIMHYQAFKKIRTSQTQKQYMESNNKDLCKEPRKQRVDSLKRLIRFTNP